MASEKKLLRPRDGRMIAGVCAAFARTFGVDATLVRVLMVLLVVLGVGSGVLVYLISWILIPQEDVI